MAVSQPNSPEWFQLVGRSASENDGTSRFAARLIGKRDGIPFNLTIGCIVRKGKAICQHDERLVQRFNEGNTQAWLEEGCPFHLWLTSPAFEILDVTFAMNLGWAKHRDECAHLIVYQSAHDPPGDSVLTPDAGRTGFLSQDRQSVLRTMFSSGY